MPGSSRSFGLAQRLVQKGHEVHLITSERGNKGSAGSWFQTEESGIHVHWFPVPYSNAMPYRNRLKAFSKFSYLAAKKATSMKSDIVFASSTPLTIALPAVYAAKRTKIPMVFEVRDLWPELPIAVGALKNPVAIKAAKFLELFAYCNSNRIVALSPGMKDGIVETGYPEDLVTVIPNYCELDLFNADAKKAQELRNQYDWLQDRPLVIYVGTIGIINGVDYLARLAAATRILDPEIRFLVLGSGREEGKVRQLAEHIGAFNQNFFMLPDVAKLQVPAWLAAADIATSLFIDIRAMWANSANKFFDALAAGLPIAINYGGWQAEIIQENSAGLVFDVNDIHSSAILLVESIHNKEWLFRAGAASRRLAEECFSKDQLAEELESVLRQAIDEYNST